MKIRNDRSGCPERTGEELERHLFVCEDCRAEARLSAAWRALGGVGAEEPPSIREEFLGRVLGARNRQARRDRRLRLLLAAAALLLFTFFAGGGHKSGTGATPELQAEDAYASVAAPFELERLLAE
jgi:ferric-dicitrate binding protein FerR (iron transport regulator)